MINDFEWKPDYGLGVAVIDDAHRAIFAMAKRLYFQNYIPEKRALGTKAGLHFLKVYVDRHFGEEEAYMAAISHADLAEHAEQHRHFREIIVPSLEKELKYDLYSEDATYRFLDTMRLWLANHILVHDLAITGRNDRKG